MRWTKSGRSKQAEKAEEVQAELAAERSAAEAEDERQDREKDQELGGEGSPRRDVAAAMADPRPAASSGHPAPTLPGGRCAPGARREYA
jgi:hypothetical protein